MVIGKPILTAYYYRVTTIFRTLFDIYLGKAGLEHDLEHDRGIVAYLILPLKHIALRNTDNERSLVYQVLFYENVPFSCATKPIMQRNSDSRMEK